MFTIPSSRSVPGFVWPGRGTSWWRSAFLIFRESDFPWFFHDFPVNFQYLSIISSVGSCFSVQKSWPQDFWGDSTIYCAQRTRQPKILFIICQKWRISKQSHRAPKVMFNARTTYTTILRGLTHSILFDPGELNEQKTMRRNTKMIRPLDDRDLYEFLPLQFTLGYSVSDEKHW